MKNRLLFICFVRKVISLDDFTDTQYKMTHLNGVITPEAVDRLEDELGGIFTVVKTHHYEQGQKYGHLAKPPWCQSSMSGWQSGS